MFKRTLHCSICEREIEDYEEIYTKMQAPRAGMVEIKAYLKNNSEITCKECYKKEQDFATALIMGSWYTTIR